MIEYKIKITPQFYILNGSGSGDLQHDSCYKETAHGIPYLAGTSIKGILRESMLEVLEMQGNQDVLKICNEYFGRSGSFKINSHINYISNAYPEWKSELEADIQLNKNRPPFTKKLISNFFAAKISQTSLSNGVAVTGSLRTVKALNHLEIGNFICSIYINGTIDEKLMQMTILNAGYLGENRNRGLGAIKMEIIAVTQINDNTISNISTLERIKYRITTLSPVIMSTQKGDENIINTETYILGSKVLGALASSYTKKYLNEDYSQQDENFSKLFISGDLKISSALPESAIVLPFNIQENKLIKGQYIDIFNEFSNDIQGVIKYKYYKQQSLYEVSKSQVFHNSRENRTAGSSQDDDETGSIFYYESIDENQTFEGYIEGTPEILAEFLSKFALEEIISIGTSKSVKYGLCKVTFEPISLNEESCLAQYLLFQTPCILLNDELEAEVSEDIIKANLGVDLEKMLIKTEEIKSFNTQWGGNNPSHIAIKPGSIIKLSLPNNFPKRIQLGQYKERGFGEIACLSEDNLNNIINSITYNNNNQIQANLSTYNTILAKSIVGNRIINKYLKKISGEFRNILNEINLDNNQIQNLIENLGNKREDEWLKFLNTIMERPLGIKLIAYGVYDNFLNRRLIDGVWISDFKIYSEILIRQLKFLKLQNP